MRINRAYSQIKEGDSVTETAFEIGYESLSGFSESVRNIFGYSPSQMKNKTLINIIRFSTKLGPMFACATEKGLCLLEFTDRKALETEFTNLCKKMNAVILPGSNKHLETVQEQIKEYMDGKRTEFNISLDIVGTEFQKSVWNMLLNIPYGKTWTYKYEAEKLNKPSAVRAVANANGNNKIAIIIPCHRVIGSDGDLTGYAGGLGRKKWLIELENQYLE